MINNDKLCKYPIYCGAEHVNAIVTPLICPTQRVRNRRFKPNSILKPVLSSNRSVLLDVRRSSAKREALQLHSFSLVFLLLPFLLLPLIVYRHRSVIHACLPQLVRLQSCTCALRKPTTQNTSQLPGQVRHKGRSYPETSPNPTFASETPNQELTPLVQPNNLQCRSRRSVSANGDLKRRSETVQNTRVYPEVQTMSLQ
jgi:hypothetical protein